MKKDKGIEKLKGKLLRIELAGKEREKRLIEYYREKPKKELQETLSESERNTYNKGQYEAYKKRLQGKYERVRVTQETKPTTLLIASKVDTKVSKGLESLSSKIGTALQKKVTAKKVFKNNQMVATIKEVTPAPYIPLYFKQEIEQTKRSMFFE